MDDVVKLRIAWFCWVVPAVVGVGTTILFALTGNEAFAKAGLHCALFGTILFAIGIAFVGAANTGPRILLGILLLSNFPLALACAAVGIRFVGGDPND
jgi:hypothetical protein